MLSKFVKTYSQAPTWRKRSFWKISRVDKYLAVVWTKAVIFLKVCILLQSQTYSYRYRLKFSFPPGN